MSGSNEVIAFVGSYEEGSTCGGGGIYTVAVTGNGAQLDVRHHLESPRQAGYLYYAESTHTLYSVDERKTDGRGPVSPAASVHAFSVDQTDGALTPLSSHLAPGPRPTYLDADMKNNMLFCANHGDFQHVEKIEKDSEGNWVTRYEYDDSTAIAFSLDQTGNIAGIHDVMVFGGHGKDPNFSPQNGGHAQASSHAHCIVAAPAWNVVFVCDKGTDKIHVLRYRDGFETVSVYQMPEETGPRHLALDLKTYRVYVTCEFASELASFSFDPVSGKLTHLQSVSTVTSGYKGFNEPAHLCLHPEQDLVYVNNRGEDSLVWFSTNANGQMVRQGGVSLSKSIHPGLAARSFCFSPCGRFFLIADRAAHLLRSYRVDDTGNLHWLTEIAIPDPAFVCFMAPAL